MSKQENARFWEALRTQVRFIEKSCAAYDSGDQEESIRIAAALRIIFHDTRSSVSLIRHLHLGDLKMLSTSRGHGDITDYLAFELHLDQADPATMTPFLGRSFAPIPLSVWWNQQPVFAHEGEKYTRRRIILSAADKDGGAHYDAKLESFYEVLTSGHYGLAITATGTALPFEQGITHRPKNTHLALLRQFGHEALASVKRIPGLRRSL